MKTMLIALLLMAASFVALAQAPLRVGDKAPDFAIPNGDGKLITLSEHTARGPVVIIFYRGFW
jgi:peroxiredoxin